MRTLFHSLSVVACFVWVLAFERAFERLLGRLRPYDDPQPGPVAPVTTLVLSLLVVAAFVYLLAAVLRPEDF